MDLELRHLRLVEAIAERESVTQAGRSLYLTQSALSHQLRDIETRLGTPLFHRVGKRMVLTPAGRKVLDVARRVLVEVEGVEGEIKDLASRDGGVLRIAVECYTCYHWLPSLLEPFRAAHPRIEVRILADETKRPIDALLEGRLDLAIVTRAQPDRRLRFRPLFSDEFVVVMRPDHPLAARDWVRPTDFAEEHLLIYSTPEENTAMQQVLTPAGIRPRRITQAQLTEAILELVKSGHGISVMARWAVARDAAAGSVALRPLGRRGLHRRWFAVRRREAAPPRHLLAFEELLAQNPLANSSTAGRSGADRRRRRA
ncbi:MAG: LysR family transcriptional regulator [Planctomycetes bacterium]|nr:LysR family transcriptional regulator [Planctomycetota bacterium]MBI3846989.1 LysR family transcriptional regulator [Planctomycetota bacterium]